MEEDKKKRKNNKKKKKNKQHQQQQPVAAVVDDTASSNAGETSSDQNPVERDHLNASLGDINGGLNNGSNTFIEGKGGHNNCYNGNADSSVSVEAEKQKWLQEEAKLREMLKQLLYEKDSNKQLQANLESSIKQLQYDNDSWQEKEVSLKQRISQLVQEKADANLREENLRGKLQLVEKENFFLVENENSSKELTANLSNESTRLRMQVLELEGVKNSLLEEKRQLLESISTLEDRIQDLERTSPSAVSPEDDQKNGPMEDLNAQIDAACALVEKLVTENAELVEKLNELYMELNRRSVIPGLTSIKMPDYAAGPDPVSVSGSGGDVSSSSKSTNHFETVPFGDERGASNDVDSDYANVGRHSSETTMSGEIVQIPLDEHEVQDLEAQTNPSEIDDGVPLTDAPLIGAPFRLIGFFTKYVSGADLVNKSSDSLQ